MDSTGETQPSGQEVDSYRSCGLPLVHMVGLPLCYPWAKNLKIGKNQVTTVLFPSGEIISARSQDLRTTDRDDYCIGLHALCSPTRAVWCPPPHTDP